MRGHDGKRDYFFAAGAAGAAAAAGAGISRNDAHSVGGPSALIVDGKQRLYYFGNDERGGVTGGVGFIERCVPAG